MFLCIHRLMYVAADVVDDLSDLVGDVINEAFTAVCAILNLAELLLPLASGLDAGEHRNIDDAGISPWLVFALPW